MTEKVLEVTCYVVPFQAFELAKEWVYPHMDEFSLGVDIDNMIEKFAAGENIHWLDEIVTGTIDELDVNSQFLDGGFSEAFWNEPGSFSIVQGLVESLQDKLVQWLISERRDNKINDIFNK